MKPIHIALITESENATRLTSVIPASELMITGQFNHPQQVEDTANIHDIIVIDSEATSGSVLSTIKKLVSTVSHAKIIVICKNPEVQQVRKLIQAGVTGVILQDELSNRFTYIARTVYAGQIAISPTILKQLLAS